ncbi:hypothetical protein G7070_02610 [Propioniciclava coleopterorum]|uniref:protein-tyrosine-phosphatase n=1 Tax=Propioniciclava coleopterorum TaxID=2714937 RepID=A0A6G7Y3U7_9ACTN|nr:hypothetical protein [Propioniciclava coleopterorum]QIK71379.1 hypothetical protein G7070_02610 [Propioniciclava coleopterorum]
MKTMFPTPGGPAGRRHERPYRVLFVCTANICRSAYADVVTRAAGIPGIAVGSAGTRGWAGHPMDPPMARQVAAPADAGAHVARALTRDLAAAADLILAMGAEHRAHILEEWIDLGPRTFLIGQAARNLELLPPGTPLAGVAPHLWGHRDVAPDDEVPDPYRRGEAAAAAAAALIDRHLARVLDGLRAAARAGATPPPRPPGDPRGGGAAGRR